MESRVRGSMICGPPASIQLGSAQSSSGDRVGAIVLGTLLQPSLAEFLLLGFVAVAAFALALLVSVAALRRVTARS